MTGKIFIKNLIFIGLFFLASLLLVLLWLRVYTNHGQKLNLPEFVGMDIQEATATAKKASFQIIVNDSVHIIGKIGGTVIDQNPKPNSKVKENRKVYVTTAKFIADRIKVQSLPILYGREYNRKSKELSFMDLNSVIKDYQYDPGEPDHILEVYYNDVKIISREGEQNEIEIEKGGTLQFVLSKKLGGEMAVPDVVCMDFETATFLIENLRLKVGIANDPDIAFNQSAAFVAEQYPPFDPNAMVQIGDSIILTLSRTKPVNCN